MSTVSTRLHVVVVLWGYVFCTCKIYHWGIDKFSWDYEHMYVQSELLRKAIWSMFQIRICLILQVSFPYFKVTEFIQEFNETILLC